MTGRTAVTLLVALQKVAVVVEVASSQSLARKLAEDLVLACAAPISIGSGGEDTTSQMDCGRRADHLLVHRTGGVVRTDHHK